VKTILIASAPPSIRSDTPWPASVNAGDAFARLVRRDDAFSKRISPHIERVAHRRRRTFQSCSLLQIGQEHSFRISITRRFGEFFLFAGIGAIFIEFFVDGKLTQGKPRNQLRIMCLRPSQSVTETFYSGLDLFWSGNLIRHATMENIAA